MNRLLTIAVTLVTVVLMGCAQMGLAQPKTFEDRLAAATKTSTFVLKSSTLLLQSGKIQAKDARNVIQQSDVAMAGVTLARELGEKEGDTKLATSLAILQALDNYVVSKGATK